MSIERLHEIWPEWTVQGQIGEGSFGKVYRAVHVEQGVSAFAAIKVISIPQTKAEIDSLRSEGIDENGTKTYFEGIVTDSVNEIKLMQSLKGLPNIVNVEDFRVLEKVGEIGWDIFIRMELLTPLNVFISDKKLSEADVMKLGCDICSALEVCNRRNIIHRDIKPENIFVNEYGIYKLGDFGIARKMENLTGGLSQKGAFNYMAPEVANSTQYDSRVDIYSLGIVLYRLLNNNRLPFLDSKKQVLNPNDRRMAVERRMSGEQLPVPCEASKAMANLILRACAYNPNRRFNTASEMKQALEAVNNGSYIAVPVETNVKNSKYEGSTYGDETRAVRRTPVDNTSKTSKPFGKKHTVRNLLIVVGLIALILGSGYMVYQRSIDTIQIDYSGGNILVGDTLASDDFSVVALLKNGDTKRIDSFEYEPKVFEKAGANIVTVTAKRHSNTISINAIEVCEISANYIDNKVPIGSTIDKNKLLVTGVCSDGSEMPLTDYSADFSQVLIPGKNKIVITYKNLETILDIEVERPVITVSFDPNGGNCDERTRSLTYGDSIGLLPKVDDVTGYSFQEWLLNGNVVNDGDVLGEVSDVTLSASWKPNTYTVTFHNNNETDKQELSYGQQTKLKKNAFTKKVSRFSGWATSSDSRQVVYKDSESVSNLATENGANVDLFAVWELDITLLLNDLVNDSGTTTIYNSPSNGFTMFGTTYTGFTVHLGASYNLWGNGTQYCVFNIASWTDAGDTLKMTYGHIDGSENGKRRITIYFDSSESAAYVFNYDSTNPPATVDIDISSHSSMKIVVDNLSGGQPTVGISFDSIS